jgi:hypothetical protein
LAPLRQAVLVMLLLVARKKKIALWGDQERNFGISYNWMGGSFLCPTRRTRSQMPVAGEGGSVPIIKVPDQKP